MNETVHSYHYDHNGSNITQQYGQEPSGHWYTHEFHLTYARSSIP